MNDLKQSFFFPQDTTEIWLPVRGYEGLYLVSDRGQVKYAVTRGGRSGGGGRCKAGTLKRLSETKDGYLYTSLTDAYGNEKKIYLHRIVLESFMPCDGMENLDVNHVNGQKNDCCLSNLEWLTHRDNIMHARTVLKAWDRYKYYRLRVTSEQHADIEAILAVTNESYAELIHRLVSQEAQRLQCSYRGDSAGDRKQKRVAGKPLAVKRPVTLPLF